jgi:hypothetical protein
MTDATQNEALSSRHVAAGAPAAMRGRGSHLFGPIADFLLLGGGAAIVLGLIALFLPQGIAKPQQAFVITSLMILINQPHFAHSYQIFYRNFSAKAFGQTYPRALRLRYLFAGLIAPILLILFLAFGVWRANIDADTRLLSYGANLMFFLVGWHYAKQGYGILIVDSVQKRVTFPAFAKTVLRVNAYACWMVSWIGINHALSSPISFLGITYYTVPIPSAAYYAALAVGAASSLAAIFVFAQLFREARTLPWNGIVAYFASLYLWIILVCFNPIFLLVVPTFHSLQYLAVVWRYQLNVSARAEPQARRYGSAAVDRIWPDGVSRRLAVFSLTGIALGALGFIALPNGLDAAFSYRERVFGPTLFLFLFYIFINVHHYFLDNVMWRRGNPDIQKHLFARG